MEKLTLLEREVLEVLEKLEYCCQQFELHNKEGFVGEIEIMVSDVERGSLKKIEDLYDIAKYLQINGIDFSITFDLINDSSMMYIDGDHPSEEFIQLGVIKGEDIKIIREKITSLKNKLSVPMVKKILIKDMDIALNNETCVLTIGGTEILLRPESDECALVRAMSGLGLHEGLEWDEIEEMQKPGKTPDEVKRFIGDTRDRINAKVQKELHTPEVFIERKNSRYTLIKKIQSTP